jgi:hypothetical protein
MFQTGGIGLTGGIYFFWLYVLTPISSLRVPENRKGNSHYTVTILPLLILFSIIPLYQSYYAESLQTRHWYMWAWQMFPLYISLAQNFSAWIFSSGVSSDQGEDASNDATAVKVTVGSMALLSACIWIYTLSSSPYSIQQMFVPDYFLTPVPNDFVEQARHFLKWDQVCGSGSSLLWLFYSFSDLKRANMTSRSWLVALFTVAGLTVCFGPGAAFAISWLWREKTLLGGQPKAVTMNEPSEAPLRKRSKAFRYSVVELSL